MRDPELLPCDETTSALDPEITQSVLPLLCDSNQCLLSDHPVETAGAPAGGRDHGLARHRGCARGNPRPGARGRPGDPHGYQRFDTNVMLMVIALLILLILLILLVTLVTLVQFVGERLARRLTR